MTRTIVRVIALVALWCALLESAVAAKQPSAITYQDGGPRHIHAFVSGSNGSLKMNHWDGDSWTWADLGVPPNATVIRDPTAITYLDIPGRLINPAAHRRIKVFAVQIGGSQHNRLVVNSWDGTQWQWSFLGGPELSGALSAVTYFDSSGQLRIYVFAVGIAGDLVAHHWNGVGWSWLAHGLPPTGTVTSLHAITYVEAGAQRIYVFCSPGATWGNGGRLSVRRFSGGIWQWFDQAGPDRPGSVNAITYVDSGEPRKIFAFAARLLSFLPYVTGLSTNYWDGSIWQWGDLGIGPFRSPSATTYASGGTRWIHVFGLTPVTLPEGFTVSHLTVTYFNGASWLTSYRGTFGPPANSLGPPSAIAFLDSEGNPRIYAFTIMQSVALGFPLEYGPQHLAVHYWNGSWHWADQGAI